MALWRAYQRALAAHPWKVQVLTAGPCGRRLVQGFGPLNPRHHQGECTQEDVVRSGGLCPMFPWLLSPTGRGTQWNVSPGQLGQTEAALACCAVSQLLPGPPALQVGCCPVRCCCLELLPVLEGTSALSLPCSVVRTLHCCSVAL
ncbi:protein Mpv17 isoform X8 [Rattus norvegicus]|uniref:protein Mpv17 isoform X8 n=1 Tax=Rattus norvegicus TaxID=10116 RepID=UPI002FD7A7E9